MSIIIGTNIGWVVSQPDCPAGAASGAANGFCRQNYPIWIVPLLALAVGAYLTYYYTRRIKKAG